MKASVQSSTVPSAPGNQDFTSGTFSSDVKCGFAFASRGKVSGTDIDTQMISIGFIDDGAAQATMSTCTADNTGGAQDVRAQVSTTEIMNFADATANTSIAEAVGSILSNGVRAAWSQENSQEIVSMLLLGGADVEASVVTGALNGTTNVNVPHGLSGGAPHVVICFSIGLSGSGSGTNDTAFGFYDVGSDVYRCISQRVSSGATASFIAQCWHTNAIYAATSAVAIDYLVTFPSIDATNLTMVASATTTTDVLMFLCLRVTGADFQVGDFLTKDSLGTQADITGMSLTPKAVLYGGLRFSSAVAAGAPENAGSVECMTIGAAANNEGSTEVASIGSFISDGVDLTVGVSDTRSVTSTNSILMFDNTGNPNIEFTVQSWDSGGVTHNVIDADATPRRFIYLAIAPAAAGGGGAAKQARFQAMLRNA